MKVQIWSDIACPWCFIGKRRFETALSEFPHRDQIEIEWKSFELNPGYPKQTVAPIIDFVTTHKGISDEEARALFAQVTGIAASEGLTYDFASALHSNTFDAHRLLHFAKETGHQGALKERLLSAYFERGESIGDHETLVRLAAEVGMDPADATAVLTSDDHASAVLEDEREAREFGLHGVPAFVIDRQLVVSGAQSPASFLQALNTAWEKFTPESQVVSQDGICSDDSCVF